MEVGSRLARLLTKSRESISSWETENQMAGERGGESFLFDQGIAQARAGLGISRIGVGEEISIHGHLV